MMKKLLAFTAVALVISMSPALADHHGGAGHHKGKMFEKHDLNGDGVISKEEFLSHAEDKFGKMDADGNGEISKDEAEAAHAKMKEKWKERREKDTEDGGSASEPSEE
ncbi:MAG: hypothetical protein R3E13_05610 [Alphaproteobacteria bacterium]